MVAKKFKVSRWVLLGLICVIIITTLLSVIFGPQSIGAFLVHPATAAWVQAIGSIGAIGIAIWIAGEGTRSASRAAKLNAENFLRMGEAAIGGLWVTSCVDSEEGDVQSARFICELREVQLIGQSIPIALLDSALSASILEMRTLLARCPGMIETRNGLRDGPFRGRRSAHEITEMMLKATWDAAKKLIGKSE